MLAEGKRTPRAVYMLYKLLEPHCNAQTISKEELNTQLAEECVFRGSEASHWKRHADSKPSTRYGVDVHVSIALGGAPPTDEDYERVEAKLEEAVRNEGNVVPVTKK